MYSCQCEIHLHHIVALKRYFIYISGQWVLRSLKSRWKKHSGCQLCLARAKGSLQQWWDWVFSAWETDLRENKLNQRVHKKSWERLLQALPKGCVEGDIPVGFLYFCIFIQKTEWVLGNYWEKRKGTEFGHVAGWTRTCDTHMSTLAQSVWSLNIMWELLCQVLIYLYFTVERRVQITQRLNV